VDFPDVSVKDGVRLQLELLKEGLNVRSVKSVIGGSFGGMQTLEFAVQSSEDIGGTGKGGTFVRSCIPIACGTEHTAWQIGISEVQRQCIYKVRHKRIRVFMVCTLPHPPALLSRIKVNTHLTLLSTLPAPHRIPIGLAVDSPPPPPPSPVLSWPVKWA